MFKKSIPNLITCLNLTCGLLAILCDDLTLGVCLVLMGGLFDVFDGLAARALGVTSGIGEDLDSLADIVSFGVAPAFLFYKAFAVEDQFLYLLGPIIIVLAGALRLARFNNMSSKSLYFEGLAIPSSGLLLCGFVYGSGEIDLGLGMFLLLALLLAALNVSRIKMFSFKQFGQREVQFYFGAIVGIAIVMLLWKPNIALAVVLSSYILLACLDTLSKKIDLKKD